MFTVHLTIMYLFMTESIRHIISRERLLLKKGFFTAATLSLFLNNQSVNSAEREVRLFSGRHYKTDKEVYQKFQELLRVLIVQI